MTRITPSHSPTLSYRTHTLGVRVIRTDVQSQLFQISVFVDGRPLTRREVRVEPSFLLLLLLLPLPSFYHHTSVMRDAHACLVLPLSSSLAYSGEFYRHLSVSCCCSLYGCACAFASKLVTSIALSPPLSSLLHSPSHVPKNWSEITGCAHILSHGCLVVALPWNARSPPQRRWDVWAAGGRHAHRRGVCGRRAGL